MLNVVATLILAAEEAEPSGVDLLLPETSELIAGIIAFAIVFFFVWKFAIPWFNQTLEARQTAIKAELTAAEEAKREAQSLLDDYKEQIASARAEANQIIEEARQAAERVRADLVSQAEQEAEQIKARAREEIELERQRAAEAIRREVAALSLEVAEKLVGRSLDRDAQRALVEQFIDELGGARA